MVAGSTAKLTAKEIINGGVFFSTIFRIYRRDALISRENEITIIPGARERGYRDWWDAGLHIPLN